MAKAIIATFILPRTCDYRIRHGMELSSNDLIDALGGTSAVAKMVHCPTSTVHSWRKNGIPSSRLEHIKLVWKSDGQKWPPTMLASESAA